MGTTGGIRVTRVEGTWFSKVVRVGGTWGSRVTGPCRSRKHLGLLGLHGTLGKSLYNFPGNERRQELFMTQALESD